MNLSPYLVFDGTCKAAFDFYAKVFGATPALSMTHGESPIRDDVPKTLHDRILHATLDFGHGRQLMGSDAMPGQYQRPQGFVVSYATDTVDETRRVFDALLEGGRVTMPIGATFWSAQFGMLVDRFGIPWMINCQQEPST